MELHAIWNRVDQLEKLLISQAKEIDVLRRMVNSTQVSIQNLTLQGNNLNNNCISNNHNFNNNSTVQLIHKPFVGNQVNNSRNSIQLNSISKGNQQVNNIFNKSTTMNQPTYLMNSFVHPSIAIPPTNLVSTYNNDGMNNKSKINNNNNNNDKNNSRLDFEANVCKGNFSSVSSTMMPPHSSNMNRWSVGPNLRLLDNAVDKRNLDSHNLTEAPHGRHKRQSFVEILTCFCPCFSMC